MLINIALTNKMIVILVGLGPESFEFILIIHVLLFYKQDVLQEVEINVSNWEDLFFGSTTNTYFTKK